MTVSDPGHVTPTFLTVGSGTAARRIACRHVPAKGTGDGQRPAVLWLSGFNSTMDGTKVSALAAHLTALGVGMTRFDYSGHGLSDGRFEDGTISGWLEETEAVVDRFGDGPLVVVGSSMGGWLALLLALEDRGELGDRGARGDRADRIAGLVLIAPAWDMTERLMWASMPDDVRATVEANGVWHRPSRYGDDDYPITRRLIEDGRRHLLPAPPIPLRCPVTILHSLDDPDVPAAGSITLAERIGSDDVELQLVKGAGHRLSRAEDITRLIEVVDRHLAR
ncbi:MAG: alpha/beta fold hydrolase [Pseudomonadota bacterium]